MGMIVLTMCVLLCIPPWLRSHVPAQSTGTSLHDITVVVPVISGECANCSIPTRAIIDSILRGTGQRKMNCRVFSVVHTPRKVEMDYLVASGRTFGQAILDVDGSMCRSLRGKDRSVLAVAYYREATVVLRKLSDVSTLLNTSRP